MSKKTPKQIWAARKARLGDSLNAYIYKNVKAWRLRNPQKVKAHRKVFVAVRNGSLKKEKCFCGKLKVEAHHDNYGKPLKIVWLCKKHHREYDLKRRRKLTKTKAVV